MSNLNALFLRFERAPGPVVTAIVFIVYGLGARRAAPGIHELDWLRELPRAHAAVATSSPALYAGRLHGPPGRVTPAGNRAAAYWWSVVSRGSEDNKVYCKERERSNLTLETPTGTMRIAFTEASPDLVGLITTEKQDEFDRRFVIDLGDARGSPTESLPNGTCSGDNASYDQLFIREL